MATEPTDRHPIYDLIEPDVVHQASGMISVRDHISCVAALGALRRHATITNQSLLALSVAIVARAANPVLDGVTPT